MKIAGITLAGHENVCVCSCTISVVLIVVIFTISIGISAYFVYSHCYLRKNVTRVKFSNSNLMNLSMGQVKEINIKNRTYYFFNDMINIEVFDSNLLKIDKMLYKNINIYYIGYISIKKMDDYESIHSINPLYLIIGEVDGHIEVKKGSKYLVFDSTDKNQKVLKKYTGLWNGTRNRNKNKWW